MTGTQVDRIVISREELDDVTIDERLAQQRSVGPPTLQPIEERGRLDFVYSTWFYLMVAGLCGALAAWAILEPYFDDGIRFTGRVEQVEAEDNPPGVRRVVVSGVPILVTSESAIRAAGNSQLAFAVDDLRVDTVVTLFTDFVPGVPIPVAAAIRVEPPETPTPRAVNLAELQSAGTAAGWLLFPLVGALVGLATGCIEGLVCRTVGRALRCGVFGLIAGFLGGAVSGIGANLLYAGVGTLGAASLDNLPGFILQMFRRGLGWTIAGMAMGLGQGLALKNRKLLLNGFIGGLIGGLVGGLLFDPISVLIADPTMMRGAEASRAIGFAMIGAGVGLFIGITDMLTRAAWLRVTVGPLRGKEFSFTQTPIRLGSSPRNEIYLFKDPKIDPVHAVIDRLRDTYELSDRSSGAGTFVNRQRIKRVRLSDGDHIAIGDSEFVYTMREKRHA